MDEEEISNDEDLPVLEEELLDSELTEDELDDLYDDDEDDYEADYDDYDE